MDVKNFDINVFKGIERGRLELILSRIAGIKAAVIGDICLDVYWHT
jgi:hypothetical protein